MYCEHENFTAWHRKVKDLLDKTWVVKCYFGRKKGGIVLLTSYVTESKDWGGNEGCVWNNQGSLVTFFDLAHERHSERWGTLKVLADVIIKQQKTKTWHVWFVCVTGCVLWFLFRNNWISLWSGCTDAWRTALCKSFHTRNLLKQLKVLYMNER